MAERPTGASSSPAAVPVEQFQARITELEQQLLAGSCGQCEELMGKFHRLEIASHQMLQDHTEKETTFVNRETELMDEITDLRKTLAERVRRRHHPQENHSFSSSSSFNISFNQPKDGANDSFTSSFDQNHPNQFLETPRGPSDIITTPRLTLSFLNKDNTDTRDAPLERASSDRSNISSKIENLESELNGRLAARIPSTPVLPTSSLSQIYAQSQPQPSVTQLVLPIPEVSFQSLSPPRDPRVGELAQAFERSVMTPRTPGKFNRQLVWDLFELAHFLHSTGVSQVKAQACLVNVFGVEHVESLCWVVACNEEELSEILGAAALKKVKAALMRRFGRQRLDRLFKLNQGKQKSTFLSGFPTLEKMWGAITN
eukprot:NODE_2223_length_1245_cov_21.532200_g2112_i0.p1 GENE.NODE_2223_length_1245_cov_21.532200_g2112_i0~~NODE_2223_length_1245_cov_21.532200_g2112_i0.p1  ORF type:complete len:407 (-),score=89.29 NODE_2223_length_1245_cov_21.532200_g2112_i0:25-1140(-)